MSSRFSFFRLWRLWKHDSVMFTISHAGRYMLGRAFTVVDVGDLEAGEILTAVLGEMLERRRMI